MNDEQIIAEICQRYELNKFTIGQLEDLVIVGTTTRIVKIWKKIPTATSTERTNMEPEPKIYIGDGVYAIVDNNGVRLYTDREDNGRNWIILEPWMVKAFVRFCEQHEVI